MEEKEFLKEGYIRKKVGSIFELFEDGIVAISALLLFYLNVLALYDIFQTLLKGEINISELTPKFLYVFVLIELFRLMIIYLTERRIDISMIVKTTLISILRELIVRAPHLKSSDYYGIGFLISVLALAYYVPKFFFLSEKAFALKPRQGYPKLSKEDLEELEEQED